MKKLFLAITISALMMLLTVVAASASDDPKPESIVEKMSFKLVRGVTNIATSPAEIPKQIIITGRNHGPVGYVVGPLKGVGMTLYRGFIGLTETIFFLVPQPGYYDPMIDPEFVWHGWENPRANIEPASEEQPTEQKSGEK